MNYQIIDVNKKNLDEYGLFCKQSQKKEVGYQNKIKWIQNRFKEGLRYKILKVKEGNKIASRGFIEYIPGEYSWRGIDADGFMVIHCIWVVGRHKKKGYASKLLQECISDAKELEMFGVVGMTAEKGGWLPTKKFFEKQAFKKVDEFQPYFGLYVKIFKDNAPTPKFFPISEDKRKEYGEGITILYSHQCPYIPLLIDDVKQFADNNNLDFQVLNLKDSKEAQLNQVHPYGTYCILCKGELLSYKPGMRKETLDLLKAKQ
ncbi:MAG: N-acetyltransferase family protein [Candidatus Hodarchaeales archaeon]|jgi:ribosomal protein S18 acetylase RimI-like enzyme